MCQAAHFLRFLHTTMIQVAPFKQTPVWCYDCLSHSRSFLHFFSLSQFAELSTICSFSCTFGGA